MTNELRHTPKLRLLSAFLAAAMTLTTLPAAAFAADGIISDLSVAGKSVTADNAADILGNGTAKYEGSVLTLNGEITVPQNKAGIMPIRSITIDGTGTLTGTEKTGYGIFPQADKAEIAAGADITLERFNCGTYAYGVDGLNAFPFFKTARPMSGTPAMRTWAFFLGCFTAGKTLCRSKQERRKTR